jgi:hypothetical protein
MKPNVVITSITPPAVGWPVVAYCGLCRRTTIALSFYAAKPKDGDFWLFSRICLDEELGNRHNLLLNDDPARFTPWRATQ